jgi:hypothetical protein
MKATTSREFSNIDPAQLRAALELGFASAHRKPAPAAAAANPAARFYKGLRSVSWVLIGASAAAILAAVVVR